MSQWTNKRCDNPIYIVYRFVFCILDITLIIALTTMNVTSTPINLFFIVMLKKIKLTLFLY